MSLSRNATYLGKFVEERDGVKCLVHKYEEVIPIVIHNAKVDAQVASISSQKIAEDIKVGKVQG